MSSFDESPEMTSVGHDSVHLPHVCQYKVVPSTDVAHQKKSKPPFMQEFCNLLSYLKGNTHGYWIVASQSSAISSFESLIKVTFY